MEQKCSLDGKIISLHLQRCSGYCPNASSCYHINKEIDTACDLEGDAHIVTTCIRSGAKVHDSICTYYLQHHYWLEKYANYNVTLSCDLLRSNSELKKFKNQLQVTVYNFEDVWEFREYQKLFLIKDDTTYARFCWLLGGYDGMGRIHFLLDQEYITPELVQEIIVDFNERAEEGQTLDSCLTSWLVNGECPYADGNYIDLTYDDTVRSCPYAKKGVRSKRGESLDAQFGIQTLPSRCKYMEYFGGTLDEENPEETVRNDAKVSSLQNNFRNHVCGSYIKHRRRFSSWSKGNRGNGNSESPVQKEERYVQDFHRRPCGKRFEDLCWPQLRHSDT